jgi:FKBP-type peptidyl-prolyl cis-trans isomerase
MMSKFLASFFLILCFIFPACQRHHKEITEEEYRKTKEAMVGVNRILIKKDAEKIKAYLKRRNLSMKQTESGLWYAIIEKGTGNPVKEGQKATILYKVELLDGTLCYHSDSLGARQFRVGKGGVESGLEEGILLLHEGDRALFIMPPHLAHGLTGDGNCIPARSIIVYEVKLINLEN